MRVRGWRAGAAALAVVASTAGCTGGGGAQVREAGLINPPAREAWRLGITAAGQPRIAGGVAVVFATSPDRSMTLTAIDPEKGRILWTRPASAGLVGTGSEVEPGLATANDGDEIVTWLEPHRLKDESADEDDGILSRIVVADPRSGKVLARSAPAMFTEQPSACDTGEGACASFYDRDGKVEKLQQLEIPGARDGDDDPDEPTSRPARSNEDDGADGFVLVTDPNAALTRDDGEHRPWSVPLRTLFGTDMEPHGARLWYVDSTHHVMYLTMTRRLQPGRHDASEAYTTIAVTGDGRVRWRRPGTVLGCFSMRARVEVAQHGIGIAPVLCRYDGPVTVSASGDVDESRAVGVRIEGFDASTGRATWSWQVGTRADLWPQSQWSRPVALAGPTRFLVAAGGKSEVLDSLTGRHSPPQAGFVGVCQTRRQFDYDEHYWLRDGGTSTLREGGWVASVCTPDGKPTTRSLPGVETLATLGKRAGDTVVVTTGFSVVGYR
ncbi:MAG: hypothetical protein U0Q15_01120 [Kineosporiaceae bacterium]